MQKLNVTISDEAKQHLEQYLKVKKSPNLDTAADKLILEHRDHCPGA